jgi:hypothetical protein
MRRPGGRGVITHRSPRHLLLRLGSSIRDNVVSVRPSGADGILWDDSHTGFTRG